MIGRYFDIQKGEILIDGVDIRQIDKAVLRRAIGQVQQDVFLFTGDIKGNISLDNESISREDVIRAARTVHADTFIEKMSGTYDAPVTERGSTLSAGQRQLISFARTLAYEPKILVLDEATANIDTETESLITQALSVLMKDRTTIMVAHRLSTIQHADKIIVLHHCLSAIRLYLPVPVGYMRKHCPDLHICSRLKLSITRSIIRKTPILASAVSIFPCCVCACLWDTFIARLSHPRRHVGINLRP